MSLVTRYLVIQDGLSEFVGRAISWLTLAMIAVLMLEIVAHYFLNSPTIWAMNRAPCCMVLFVCWPAPIRCAIAAMYVPK